MNEAEEREEDEEPDTDHILRGEDGFTKCIRCGRSYDSIGEENDSGCPGEPSA